jgi:hypothetical protein
VSFPVEGGIEMIDRKVGLELNEQYRRAYKAIPG